MKSIINILKVLFIFSFLSTNAQHGDKYQNSTIAEVKLKENEENLKNAHIAFLDNDLKKMKYHIFRSQKDGFRTREFFYLLGVYSYFTKDYKMAKEYWYTAYRRDCYECKDLVEKTKKKIVLDSILIENSRKFLDTRK